MAAASTAFRSPFGIGRVEDEPLALLQSQLLQAVPQPAEPQQGRVYRVGVIFEGGSYSATSTASGAANAIFHDVRRSAIRNMIRADVSEPVAMSISGHRSAAIFRRYNITSVDDQRRALAATQAYAAARGRKDKRSSR